jgi:hypothetical protein
MNSRERVRMALNHQEADRIPLDLGGSDNTGMHVSAVYRLRQALGLDAPGTPIKVIEPFQMVGEIKMDLADALGADVVFLFSSKTMFGFKNEGWKPWTLFDGTPVLVPDKFNTFPEPNGDILLYPEGDLSAPSSGRMPHGGWYFDAIIRQPPLNDSLLKVEDNLEEFELLSEEDLEYFKNQAEKLYCETDKAIMAYFGGTSFGDISLIPVPWMKHPKGIRDIAEWYISLSSRRNFVYKIFERQCEIALYNLEKIYQAVGARVNVIFITGADFGMQTGPLISPNTYRQLFKPFHKQVNDWVHRHTPWKTFIHSCGSVVAFLEDFIDAGFDILNPVQITAAGMNPEDLKSKYGDRLTFWGGGVDTQRIMPFGTPAEVRNQVREHIKIFGPGGGYIFNPIHNIQPQTPVENLLAMYDTVKMYGLYPLD